MSGTGAGGGAPAPERTALRRRGRLTVFLTVLLDLLGFGMILPILPFYGQDYGASDLQIGLLFAAYSLAQLLFSPLLGKLSDRWGRRPVLLATIAVAAVAHTVFAFAGSFAVLVVARFVSGVATANLAVAQAYMADVTTRAERSKAMGMIGAAFGLGFVLGPAMGGLLSTVSLSAPGYAAALLAAANGVAAFFVLPEPAERTLGTRRAHLPALMDELRRPGIRRIVLIYLLSVLAFSAMEATFALVAAHRFALDGRHVSWVFAFIGVIVVIVQGGLIGPLTRRFGEKALLVVGLALQAVGLVAIPFAVGTTGLLAACVPLAVGNGLSSPALSSLLSRNARAEDQGGTLGIGQSAAALGRIAGPISATKAYHHLWLGAPYVGGAALMLLTAAIGMTLRRPAPAPVATAAPAAREA
jgi:multidrug resistance protein